jgi:8-amino-7-oxononanoate synthase
MANVGLLSAVACSADTIFFDAGVHASTREGIHISRAKAFGFRHHDVEHLERRLNMSASGQRFICVESIYSTDGSMAPLQEICQLARQYEAHVIVDEAHAIGVYGPGGRGLVAEHGLSAYVFAQVNTFGKALGTYGAIVLGSQLLKQVLINFATSYIYTTALPLLSLAAIKCSYATFPTCEEERRHIQKLVQLFRVGFPNASHTHIQSIPISGNENVKHVSHMLREHGFDVRPLLSPTVKQGQEVLRVCLHAFNTEKEVALLKSLLPE